MASSHFSVCVIGHSLLPTTVPLTQLPSVNVNLTVLRYPGATIDSLTRELDAINFWSRQYDGIILCIGGNDLAIHSVDTVFPKLCILARRLKINTSFLTICTIEYRLYPSNNRFGVSQENYRRKVVTINRKIKRFTRSLGCRNLDLCKHRFTTQRARDGVHLNQGGIAYFCQQIASVIRAYLHTHTS